MDRVAPSFGNVVGPGGSVAPPDSVLVRSRLAAKAFLLIEPQPLVAATVEYLLVESGAEVVVISDGASTPGILVPLDRPFDAAVLDLPLAAEDAKRLVDELMASRIPFVATTTGLLAKAKNLVNGFPVLAKPYLDTELLAALEQALASPPVSGRPAA